MKKPLLILPALLLANCASLQTASVADFNGDGAISAAENQQYNTQQSVQRENVYTESVKRRNAVNTTGDALEGVRNVRNLRDVFRSF